VLCIIVEQLCSVFNCLSPKPETSLHFRNGSQTDKICKCLLVVGAIKFVVSSHRLYT